MSPTRSRNRARLAVRSFGVLLAGLMLLVQVAAASGLCLAAGGCGGQPVGDHALHADHARVDRVCETQVLPADQVSAADPLQHVPLIAPTFVVAIVAAPSPRPQAVASRGIVRGAHVAQFLLLHRLQL